MNQQETIEKSKRMGRPILSTVDPENSSLIEQLRVKRGFSQRELGELLGGISRPTVGRYERGEIKPKGLVRDKINEMLKEAGLPEL